MRKLILAVGLMADIAFAHADDSVITECVNDLAPYTTNDDSSYWTVSEHPLVVVRVTTDDMAVSVDAIFGRGMAAAADTRLFSFGEGFLEVLSTISPGFLLLFK